MAWDALAALDEWATQIRNDRGCDPIVQLSEAAKALLPLIASGALDEAEAMGQLAESLQHRGAMQDREILRAVALALNITPPAMLQSGTRCELPPQFHYAADGWVEQMAFIGKGKRGDDDDDDDDGIVTWTRLCSPIEFLATTRNRDQAGWGLLLRIQTPDGHWHEMAVARSALITDADTVLAALADKGFEFFPLPKVRATVKLLLASIAPDVRARCVPKVGWNGPIFVLPDQIFGQHAENERIVFQPPYVVNHAYQIGGLAEGWRSEIAKPARGNSRLLFSISLALSGPLLERLGMTGGGFHWRGASSLGKTTILHTAGSVWGGGRQSGFIRSWRATDNSLEGVAVTHSDTLLALDEIADVEPRVAGKVAYMLANGQGKARADRSGFLRPVAEWRASYLSTGEVSLSDKLAEDGRRAMPGQAVRIIDLAADAGARLGVFNHLSGHNRPSDFADALNEAAARHYGTPVASSCAG